MTTRPAAQSVRCCGTRRAFLRQIGLAASVSTTLTFGRSLAAAAASNDVSPPKPKPPVPRPDLLDEDSPKELEIFQLTTDPDVPSSHLYMEAQVFTPDSRRLILHRSANAHGSSPRDPRHQYLLCDLENRCSLLPLTDELGATGASVAPDGELLYYFVDQTSFGGGRLTLKRVRLDGTQFRDLPWGRNGNEFCQGHQCWRGQSCWAITSTSTRQPAEAQLIEAKPAPHAGHAGRNTPGSLRNDLSRSFGNPQFYHFATDKSGARLVTDAAPLDKGGRLFLCELGEPGADAAHSWRYLLNPRSSGKKEAHIHPFLSPDGRMAFFNSDESGLLQAYLIRGL